MTGASSGLGRFLQHETGASALKHNQPLPAHLPNVEVLVHCAFPKPAAASESSPLAWLKKIHVIPHKKFVFISSCDVYNAEVTTAHSEEEVLKAPLSVYGQEKLECENFVKENDLNFLILRPTSLVGPNESSQNLRRLLTEADPQLTLTSDSTLNFVDYSEVLELINAFAVDRISGVFNLARASSASVSSLAARMKKTVTYGRHRYICPPMDNGKAAQIVPALKESSMDFIVRKFKI